MSDDLVTWLREQIETTKRAASPKILRDGGAWRTDSEQWEAGTGIRDEAGRPVAVAIGDYAAVHITRNDPLSAIARCEAELAILDACEDAVKRHEREQADYAAWTRGEAPRERPVFGGPDPAVIPGLEVAVRLLASGYRHRPGYQEGWKP